MILLLLGRLIQAEEAILAQQGHVVRMSGLYTRLRGPHTYWMDQRNSNETIAGNANGYVNMIHYEDAASLCLAILSTDTQSQRIFLGVDDQSLTREQIYNAAYDAFIRAWENVEPGEVIIFLFLSFLFYFMLIIFLFCK